MARTKQTARTSCYPLSHRGWHTTARGRGTSVLRRPAHDPNGPFGIVVPSPFALDGFRLHTNFGTEQLRPLADANTSSEPSYNHPARLLELPTEILLMIFRFLLPNGEVWHVTPTTKRKIHATSIHRLSPPGSPLPHAPEDQLRSLPTLSIVCRRLMDVTYATFLGGNHFVFELSSRGITSHVRSADRGLGTWFKIIRTKPVGLAPLSQTSARYLTSLTLCISLQHRQPGGYEWQRLDESIQRIVKIFEKSEHELKTLSVHLGFVQHIGRRADSMALEVDSSDGLRMQIRNDQVYPQKVSAATIETLGIVVAPLMALKGVRETRISGLLTNEMLYAYDAGNDDGKKRSAEDLSANRSMKRQRSH